MQIDMHGLAGHGEAFSRENMQTSRNQMCCFQEHTTAVQYQAQYSHDIQKPCSRRSPSPSPGTELFPQYNESTRLRKR